MRECKSFFPISNVGVGFLFGANNTFSSARVVVSLGFKEDGAHMESALTREYSGTEKLTGSHVCVQQSVLFFAEDSQEMQQRCSYPSPSISDRQSVCLVFVFPTHIISMHGARRRPSLFSRSYTVFLPPCLVILSFPLSVSCLRRGRQLASLS